MLEKVGGHTQFLQLDKSTVCKPLIPRELSFYLNAPSEIRTFTPQYKGMMILKHFLWLLNLGKTRHQSNSKKAK